MKSYIVDLTYNNMRLDRWLRNIIGNIPQSLIEKYLRSGKVKINKKKVKSSFKVKTNDKIDIFPFQLHCQAKPLTKHSSLAMSGQRLQPTKPVFRTGHGLDYLCGGGGALS